MGKDYEDNANSLYSDEDTQHFLNRLEAAAERVFEAYSERLAAESSTIGVPPSKEVVQHIPTLLQDKELTSGLSPQNTVSPLSQLCSSPGEPIMRQKRRRTCEQTSFQQLVPANEIKSGLSDKNPSLKREMHLVNCLPNFTFRSSEVSMAVQGSEVKHSSLSVKNHHQLPRKYPFGIRRNSKNVGLIALDGRNVGSEKSEKEAVEKPVDFSKEIEDAVSRIESLIPSLQKLVNSAHLVEQKNVGNLGLPYISSSVNPTRKEKDKLITTNELFLTNKSATLGEPMLSKQASHKLLKFPPIYSQVKWSRNIDYSGNGDGMQKHMLHSNGDFDSKREDIKCSNVKMTRRIVDQPSAPDRRTKNSELEKNLNVQRVTQHPRPNFKAITGRPELLQGLSSRSGSFASYNNLGHIQGLKLMPHLSYCRDAIGTEKTSKSCTPAPSVGSINSISHTKTGHMCRGNHSHTSGRIEQERGQSSKMIQCRNLRNRNTLIKKNMKGSLHARVAPNDLISETSLSSCASSTATTQQSSSSLSSLSENYESSDDSYDSEESAQHEKKQVEVNESTSSCNDDTSSYDTSYYNDLDGYSDVSLSSQMSLARGHNCDPQNERGKTKGRLRRLGKKVGMIFHHHHHHHHHYKDESDARYAKSIWKRLGEMFHHKRKINHSHDHKVEKAKKSEIKTVAKRKQEKGHFHALIGGLMKHVKTTKPKQLKNGVNKLGSGHHGVGKKKLKWWPKIRGGKGGGKQPNKGKINVGNYRSKSFAAAKMILKK